MSRPDAQRLGDLLMAKAKLHPDVAMAVATDALADVADCGSVAPKDWAHALWKLGALAPDHICRYADGVGDADYECAGATCWSFLRALADEAIQLLTDPQSGDPS